MQQPVTCSDHYKSQCILGTYHLKAFLYLYFPMGSNPVMDLDQTRCMRGSELHHCILDVDNPRYNMVVTLKHILKAEYPCCVWCKSSLFSQNIHIDGHLRVSDPSFPSVCHEVMYSRMFCVAVVPCSSILCTALPHSPQKELHSLLIYTRLLPSQVVHRQFHS